MLTLYIIKIKQYIKTTLRLLYIAVPLWVLHLLYHPIIQVGNKEYTNIFYEKFSWWQILVIFLIVINILGITIFTSLSLYHTFQRARNERNLPRIRQYFTNLLVEYLYAEKYANPKERTALFRKIKKFTRRKQYIEPLLLSITKIQETVSINHSEQFKELLSQTKLNTQIDRFLYSYNLSERILALRVISYLRIRVEKFEKKIYRYSDSSNYALRIEAYSALIRLMEGDNQLAEFIGSKYNLSLFDINIIVNAVIKNNKMNINYIDFLSSTLNRKIIVGLMLAKKRYRKGSRSLILILNYIGHEDSLLNQLAWSSFLELVPKDEGVDIIIDRFNNEPDDIKLLILKNSYQTGSEVYYNFLQNVIRKESLLIKIEALRILFKERFDFLAPFVYSEDENIQMAMKEVTDLNINY
jgi:hypothetical protein